MSPALTHGTNEPFLSRLRRPVRSSPTRAVLRGHTSEHRADGGQARVTPPGDGSARSTRREKHRTFGPGGSTAGPLGSASEMETRTRPGTARPHRLDRRVGGVRVGSGPRESARLFVFARHAESTANVARVLSSDPTRSVGLTARGRAQARQLGAQLAAFDIELAVCWSFLRTQETLAVALRGRPLCVLIDRDFDEIRAGDFDGKPIEAYWSWEQRHTPSDRLPSGESVDEALLRYANALRRLLSRTESVTLLVIHEFALRRIAEAATTPSSLPRAGFANAVAYLFDERAVERAAAGLRESARSDLTARSRRAVTFKR